MLCCILGFRVSYCVVDAWVTTGDRGWDVVRCSESALGKEGDVMGDGGLGSVGIDPSLPGR